MCSTCICPKHLAFDLFIEMKDFETKNNYNER